MKLYDLLGKYYKILLKQDYQDEIKTAHNILKRLGKRKGTLLDVGVGGGTHLREFKKLGYEVEGLDDSKEIIKLNYNFKVHKGKLWWFRVNKEYDVITILNRSLLYVKNEWQLKRMIKQAYKHLKNKGVLLMDLELHAEYFDKDKSDIRHFHGKKNQGSIVEEYDLRGDTVLYSVNLNIKDQVRLVDNKEFKLVKIKEVVDLMKENGFKVTVYSKKGRRVKNYNQPVFISGVKVKKRK